MLKVRRHDELFLRAHQQWERGKLKSAFRLFLGAAKTGDTRAWVDLGYFYDIGLSVKPNRQRALYWYTRAYRRGEECAASNIGTIWRDEGQLDRALAWFHRAVKLRDGDANLEIAKIYLRDKRNVDKAVRYLKQTCNARVSDVTEGSREEATRLLRRINKSGPA